MRKAETGSLIAVISIIVALFLVAVLGFIFWQNFLQPKDTGSLGREESTQEAQNQNHTMEQQTTTSTLKGWSVSLEAPSTWKVKEEDDSYYNYDTKLREAVKVTTLTDPSGKVSIQVRHMPFFSADGACGPSTIDHLNKEAMEDDRLIFVEAVGSERDFFLSATSKAAASAITDQFNSCFAYRDLLNQEGKNVLPPEVPAPDFKQPFVSVRIQPAFTNGSDQRSWNSQTIIDFLGTEEYLEAKAVVKTLKL